VGTPTKDLFTSALTGALLTFIAAIVNTWITRNKSKSDTEIALQRLAMENAERLRKEESERREEERQFRKEQLEAMRAERDEARKERDEALTELALLRTQMKAAGMSDTQRFWGQG
jgi:hypothetical protein